MTFSGLATIEENILLKKEVDRLKVEGTTISTATSDQLSQLRLEIEALKLKLRNEENVRRQAQKSLKDLQARYERLRNKQQSRKDKLDGSDLEDIQVFFTQLKFQLRYSLNLVLNLASTLD